MADPLALIVDDEEDIRELIQLTLSKMGIHCVQAENISKAKALIDTNHFHLCFSDMRLPDGTGLDLLDYVRERFPYLPVAILTAFGNMELAVTALKAGAFDFVSKPVDLGQLRELATNALKLRHTNVEEKQSIHTDGGTASNGLDAIIGYSPAVQALKQQIIKLARSQAPVYIQGESGSGKELVASVIHQLGPRSEGPFVPVNCGAIPADLMESEFFGHKKGSFTGATSDKDGLFVAARGGTLFLDEVADLPLNMQVKLLRSIQEKAIRPVGSAKEIATDVRILSATHKDLVSMVAQGHFRQDLFYRINVIQIEVPALRFRSNDIEILAKHFLTEICNKWSISQPKLSQASLSALQNYDFPGNIRELQNILERAITFCESNLIEVSHLKLGDMAIHHQGLAFAPPLDSLKTHASPQPLLTEYQLPPGVNLEDFLENIERKIIMDALEHNRWNRTAAAKQLGLSFRSLRYKLKKLNIDE